MTVRSLETVIRLATAHAKLRLSRSVTTDDIDEAMKMVKRSIFSERDPEDNLPEEKNDDEEMAQQKESKQPARAEPVATRKRDRPDNLRGDSPEPVQKKMKTDPEAELGNLLAAS